MGGPILARPVRARAVTLAAAFAIAAGCSGDAGESGPRGGEARGRVVDASGSPVVGAEVRVEGTGIEGGIVSYTARTDEDGRYATRLADGHYTVHAYQPVTYHDEEYWIPLAPVDGDQRTDQDSRNGVSEDFVWRTAGAIPGASDQHHGGTITVDVGIDLEAGGYAQLPEGSKVHVALAPVGPLIDGSEAKAETFAYEPEAICPTCGYMTARWTDVPVGRYTATAEVELPSGAREPLRLKTRRARADGGAVETELASSAVVQFPPRRETGLHSGVRNFEITILP